MRFLVDDPYKFFRKNKHGFRKTLAYVIIISAVFSVLNEASIYFGFTPFKLINGHVETAFIIFSSLVGGFLLVALLFALVAYRKINIQAYKTAFFVLAYSTTPFMLLGWIPHAAVKVAVLFWTLAFVTIGIHIQMKKEYRESLIITIVLLLIVAAISIASQNFILVPV